MPPTRSLRLLLVASAAVLATALTGCGHDSSTSLAASTGSPRGGGTLRIAYQAFPSGDLVVRENHWLEDALPGWTVKWSQFDSGASINTAFVAGALDIAAMGSSPVARGLCAPLDIAYQVAFVLDVAGDNEALVARDGSGIADVAGLKGKKVATSFSSTAHYSLLAALAQAGLSEKDVKLIDLEPQDILAAWTRGDIDAAYTWLPTLAELKKDGKVLIASRELATAGKPTLDLGVVSSALISKHPEVVDAWREAEARALRLIKNDPDAASTAIAKQLSMTPAVAKEQLSQGVFLTPEQLTSEQWLGSEGKVGALAANLRSAADFLKGQHKVDAVPNVATFEKAIYVKGLPGVLGS